METTRALMPRARQIELHVEELPDETLVYDLERHKARCLNRTAALVWRHCDGQTGVAEVAALAGGAMGHPDRRGGGVDGARPLEQGTLAE